MKKTLLPRFCFLFLLLALPLAVLSAADIGLLVDLSGSYELLDSETTTSGTGKLIPWFSTPFGQAGRFYLSLSLSAVYEDEEWTLVPELMETEIKYRIGGNKELRVGRLSYRDPLGFIANGLFDGVRYSQYVGDIGKINIGAWYTGLLYKKTAHITITDDELEKYDEEKLDYSNFTDTYFAPKRLLAAVDWEHWGLSEVIRLNFSLLGQFELSGKTQMYHSLYLVGKMGIPVKTLVFDLGAVIEYARNAQNDQVSFAGEIGAGWFLPTSIQDRLYLLGRFSGGAISETVTAFVPLSTSPQGYILKAKLSGLSMIQAEYTARLHETFSLRFIDSYFVLSDKISYKGYPIEDKEGYFLGNEFYAQAIWSPVSDLQLKLGGGAFMPSLGNAVKSGKALWQIDLSAVLALF